MTSFEKGEKAFETYMDSGMIVDVENPFDERSKAGEKWQRGYDQARIEYLK